MNVKELTTVTLMLCVPIFLGASPVHVTMNTLEMELLVMVNSFIYIVKYIAGCVYDMTFIVQVLPLLLLTVALLPSPLPSH